MMDFINCLECELDHAFDETGAPETCAEAARRVEPPAGDVKARLAEEGQMIKVILGNYILRKMPVMPGTFIAYCAIENLSARPLDPGRRRNLRMIYDRPERC